ncbi:MAG TPA: GNAT family N-acetyltransferase [Stellaceae bacterium]|nr:GNAT family N-acetyltransferase [Stellaceae bacterium]
MSVTTYKPLVRASTDADVAQMLAIYHHHISTGLCDAGAAYEAGVLEAEDIRRRRKNMRKHRLPHLVAEVEGVVAGYAYAVPFRKRPAYRYTLKHSIYIHPQFVHCGIGRTLLPALIDACAAAGYRQLICYVDPANEASLKLHESFGFARVGLLPAVGYKFGQWVDSVMLQRPLGAGATAPPGSWAEDDG